ncbi:unnamed protein product [Lactuca virosa]|uniref:Uncharacterized protein n=1 Tax=Lactuca virosa TaxID=75947 RepID=A0AAU9PJC4_9ASTR|nr:unnamed protein product [Lactuca virosa]
MAKISLAFFVFLVVIFVVAISEMATADDEPQICEKRSDIVASATMTVRRCHLQNLGHHLLLLSRRLLLVAGDPHLLQTPVDPHLLQTRVDPHRPADGRELSGCVVAITDDMMPAQN